MDIYRVLKFAKLRNLRLEKIGGRDSFAVDYFPVISVPDQKQNEFVLNHGGTVWIDAKEFVVHRMQSSMIRLPKPSSQPNKVGVFDYVFFNPTGKFISESVMEQAPLCDGTWLPSTYNGYGETAFINYRRNGKLITCPDKNIVK